MSVSILTGDNRKAQRALEPEQVRLRLAIERFCRRVHRAERRARAAGLVKVANRLRGLRSGAMLRRRADRGHPLIVKSAGLSELFIDSFMHVLRRDVDALPRWVDVKLAGFLVELVKEAVADIRREQGRSS